MWNPTLPWTLGRPRGPLSPWGSGSAVPVLPKTGSRTYAPTPPPWTPWTRQPLPCHGTAGSRDTPPGFHQTGGFTDPLPPQGVNPLPVLTWVLVLRKPNTAQVLLQSRAQHGGHTGDTRGDTAQLQDGGNTSLGSTGWGARGSAHTQGAGWRRWVHRGCRGQRPEDIAAQSKDNRAGVRQEMLFIQTHEEGQVGA